MNTSLIFKVRGERFAAPQIELTAGAFFGLVVLILSRGRIQTKTARTIGKQRREAWQAHAAKIQNELDAERARGWGFCYRTGRRVDFPNE